MATKDQIGEISRQLAQTSPHSRRKPSCFLDLPRELRDKIYGLALKFQLPEKVYYARTGPVTAPTTALLRACKQVHAEASGILQKCNPLVRVVTDMDAFEWECTPDGYATLGLRGPSILNARGQSFTKHLGRSGLIVMDVVATGFLVESSRDHELLIALEEFGPFCRELSIYYATVAPNCLFSLTFNIHGDAKMYWTDHWQIQLTMNAPFQVNDTVAIAKGRRWASVDELPKDLWQRKELGLLAYKAKAFQEAATIWTEAVQDLKIWSAEDCKSVCGSSELKHLQLMFILGINQAAAIIEIAKLATTSFDRQYAAMVAMLGLALAHSSLEYCPHGFGPPALLVAKLYYREAVVARMRDALSAAYEAICEAAALSPQDKVIQAEAETIDALFEENGHAGGLGDVLDYFAHMRAAGSWGGIPTVG